MPRGTPPSTSRRTLVAPSGPVAVCTTCDSRARRLAPSRPSAKGRLRSTVARPSTTVALRSFVPAGTYVSTPCFVSAAVGPRRSWRIASSAVEPGRVTAVICSPCRNHTFTVGAAAADPASATSPKRSTTNIDAHVSGRRCLDLRSAAATRKCGWSLRALVPRGEVLRLLRGQLVDRDAHRLELEACDLVVDVLRDVVDLA